MLIARPLILLTISEVSWEAQAGIHFDAQRLYVKAVLTHLLKEDYHAKQSCRLV